MQMCNSISPGLSSLTGAGLLDRSISASALSTPLSSPLSKNANDYSPANLSTSAHPLSLYMNEDSNNSLKDARELKKSSSRDPLSHRIIEKRRRDRMNKCLSDLSRLIPSHYIKKGRGRIEKTEIVEMAIKHIKQLEAMHPAIAAQLHNNQNESKSSSSCNCAEQPSAPSTATSICNNTNNLINNNVANNINNNNNKDIKDMNNNNNRSLLTDTKPQTAAIDFSSSRGTSNAYQLGFRDCIAECVQFLLVLDARAPSDLLCIRLVQHLNQQLHQHAQPSSATNLPTNINNNNNLNSRNTSFTPISSSLATSNNCTTDFGVHWPTLSIPTYNTNSSAVDRIQIKLEEMEVEECQAMAAIRQKIQANHLQSLIKPPSPQTSVFVNRLVASESTVPSMPNNLGTTAPPRRMSCSGLAKSRSLTSSPNSAGNSDTLYKFKKNIKERFQADLQSALLRPVAGSCDHLTDACPEAQNLVGNDLTIGSSYRPRSATISTELCNGRPFPNRLKPLATSTSPSAGSSVYSSNTSLATGTSSSPGFLLHPNGSFYVPIEVQLCSNLADSSETVACRLSKPTESSRILHPVSIAVQFGQSTIRLCPQSVA